MAKTNQSYFFILLLVLTSFFANFALAQNLQISGRILTKDSQFYLVTSPQESQSGQLLRITAASAEAQSSLNQLKLGDFLSGSGELRGTEDLLLYSIDFVGLKKLIGKWGIQESGEVVDIVNFFKIVGPEGLEITYLISPKSKGLEIILSNKVSTVIGSLKINSERSFELNFDDSPKVLSFQKLN